MTNRKNHFDARLGRRVRTRLTRVLVLALAGLLMAGSLAYAAGVEPVRRRVDEFLKGTAGLFRKAESSAGGFHLSPNPSGQGVLVMPLDDRGPRAAAAHAAQEPGNAKEKSSAPAEKKKSEGGGRDAETHLTGDTKEPFTKSDESKASDSGSVSQSGSSDEGEESSGRDHSDDENSDHDSHEGSEGSDDDRSGSNSGSDGDRSGSDSGQSDSESDKD